MKTEIQKAIEELSPWFDTVTTSDLQGICEAKAMSICRKYKTIGLVMSVSDNILEGIYEGRA
jgi:hypothetical protein